MEMNNKDEALVKHVENNDIRIVRKLLREGANPTLTTTTGKSAIGIACSKGLPEILSELLLSCTGLVPQDIEASSNSNIVDAKKWRKNDMLMDIVTPEGMEGLQWEDEIAQPSQAKNQLKLDDPNGDAAVEKDDEWSVLYRYYASVIEKTGEMLANTISSRDPHCLDAFRQGPIHYAASAGSIECMELLLSHNAPVNMTNNAGHTALHLAVNHPKVIELLLQHKASPNKLTFNDQLAPIHMAAKIGNTETIQLLKDAGANVNINSLTDHTPLHLAITFKKFDAALRLIHCGAKLNLEDEKGLTPLYTAIVVNDYPMAEMLLMHGARLLPSQYLLNYTIRNKMSAMTRLLIRAGENVNGRDYLGWTPILLAINERDTEMIEFLIENGAKMNGNDYILKELHIAVQQSSSLEEFHSMFKILIKNGVNIDNLNKWGETPLCLAMLMEKFQIAEYLIKEGSNVNGGCTIKAKDCLLLVRDCNNINLTKLFVNAGLRNFWPRISNDQEFLAAIRNCRERPLRAAWAFANLENKQNESCETYLATVLTNPLTLKQLSRIQIRNMLIEKIRNFDFVKTLFSSLAVTDSEKLTTSSDQNKGSILSTLIAQLELPVSLKQYLYDFPDLPPVPQDLDVFVQY